MKKLTILTALLVILLAGQQATAQVSVSVNIGVQPVWGPVGYDYVNYYYLPDIDAYYDVPAHVFVYNEGGVWVRRPGLPPAFASYDLYHGYKVVINDPNPWLRNQVYHDKYIVYKGHHDQPFIRDSRDQRYYVIHDHPMHAQYRETNHPVNHISNTQVNHVENHGGSGHPQNHGGGHGGGGGHGHGKK